MRPKRTNQRGVALIMATVLILIMSVIAIGLAFVAKGETWASMNYRMMSQARDVAEAGVNKAANYLMYTYTVPYDGGSDPITGTYDVAVSPVTYSGNPVILSADGSVSSNYPVSSVISAFNTAGDGSMAAGTTTVDYTTWGRLLFMRELDPLPAYLASGPNTVQTWEITSTASVDGIQSGKVKVVARLERQIVPIFAYAAFATDPNCDALVFGGGGTTNSYDSGNQAAGFSNTSGNVGTNGSLTTSGSTTNIYGTLSTPRTGVGNCTNGNVNAWDPNQGTLTEGMVELPVAINYPPPNIPTPGTNDLSTTQPTPCAGIAGCTAIDVDADSDLDVVLDPYYVGNPTMGSLNDIRNITISGGRNLYLKKGIYNINSITLTGSTTLYIDVPNPPGPNDVVQLNVTGTGFSGNQNVVNLVGNGIVNPTLVPETFQIAYAGTASITLAGGTNAAGLVYAPRASVTLTGGSDWYGSILGKKINNSGGTDIHYDRRLETDVLKAGPYTLDSFNWKKY